MSQSKNNSFISASKLDKSLIRLDSRPQKIELNKKKQILSDTYFTYNIHKHLKTNFHELKPQKDEHINICCFRIIQSRPNKIIKNSFIEYLLYKYSPDSKDVKNLCVFPFTEYNNGKILDIGKNIIKKLFNTVYKCIGYIRNDDGIFLFYNIDFDRYRVGVWNKNDDLWWALIDEICNHKCILNFPIHYSVTNIFLNNPKLIYLKDKNNLSIDTPVVAFYGDSVELLPYITVFGIKSSTIRPYGPYYYFTDFKGSVRTGAWTTSTQRRKAFKKSITDENGKYIQGGFVRFAVFLGNSSVVGLTSKRVKLENSGKFEDEKDIGRIKGKWTKDYDSKIIGRIKFKNLTGYFNYNTQYIIKDFERFTSLSQHLIDKDTLKINWDPEYEFYSIK